MAADLQNVPDTCFRNHADLAMPWSAERWWSAEETTARLLKAVQEYLDGGKKPKWTKIYEEQGAPVLCVSGDDNLLLCWFVPPPLC